MIKVGGVESQITVRREARPWDDLMSVPTRMLSRTPRGAGYLKAYMEVTPWSLSQGFQDMGDTLFVYQIACLGS